MAWALRSRELHHGHYHLVTAPSAHHTTPHHTTSHHTTSHHITSHHIASHHITSHHITSHHITSHHITSHHITSHHITSHHITSHHITSHHTTPHHTTPAAHYSTGAHLLPFITLHQQPVPSFLGTYLNQFTGQQPALIHFNGNGKEKWDEVEGELSTRYPHNVDNTTFWFNGQFLQVGAICSLPPPQPASPASKTIPKPPKAKRKRRG